MAVSAFAGPIVSYGVMGIGINGNPDRGPSVFDQGIALMDPRSQFTYTGAGASPQVYGWFGGTRLQVITQVPSQLSTTNIAAAQLAVAGTAMTLVSSSGAGITVNTSVTRGDNGVIVTGQLAIDLAQVPIPFGRGGDGNGGAVRIWDPTEGIARNVRITGNGNDTSATFLVSGYDLYGFPMTERITGANAGTASGAKAFKYISSVVPSGTLASTLVSVGTGDVIGLPIRADLWGEVEVTYNNTKITASTGFTAAVTTTATATTGDVRGTYALQTASDGTRQLSVYVTPNVVNINSATGLCGVTQA